jgi:RNA polymerase sigma factor (sigma-70 family)
LIDNSNDNEQSRYPVIGRITAYFLLINQDDQFVNNDFRSILKACCKGEITAQEKLYKLYYNYGMSIAVRYSDNREIAGEIYNDSFLKILNNLHKFDREKNFKSWIRQVIIHTAIDQYRKELKHNNHLELSDYENSYFHNNTIEKLLAEDIINMIHSLPHIYRLVFNLYELEGYTHDEIASQLNITDSTSRSCLSRAKSKLRYLIARKYEITK